MNTTAKEPDSHVTTRRLTKSWEIGKRKLRFYDFVKDAFDERKSEKLLVADHSYGYDVEEYLNTSIEQDLTNHLDALKAGTWDKNIPWEHQRSLLFSLMLQPIRILAGRGEAASKAELEDLRVKGDAYLDQLARAAHERFHRIAIKLPSDQELFFPSHGFQEFPVAGRSKAMMFQPTTPSTLFLCVLKSVPEHIIDEQIDSALNSGTFVAFSVGLDCESVIIPPSRMGQNEADLRITIRTLRSCAQAFKKLVDMANGIMGL